MTFEDFNINKQLLSALEDLGFTEPTPIQQKAFSVIMSGRDVVGIAQTGTGKTFAYLLPILRMFTFSKQREPRVLVVVPTRELVIQLVDEIRKLTKYMNVRTEGVYGGTNMNTQKDLVIVGLDVIVATPGRLIDLVMNGFLSLKQIKHLVIDEMDEMLSLGFRPQLTSILDLVPTKRQNLLFSATMTEEVDDVINTFFNVPVLIEVTRAGTPLTQIVQYAYDVPNFYTKLNLIHHIISTDETIQKVLIFGASKRMADLIHAHLLPKFGGEFEVVHSNKSQNHRMTVVKKFEEGTIKGLIASDILARGLDVTEVTHVINLDTPSPPELYIHRIGRTGRADQHGVSILFSTEAEQPAKAAIEKLMDKTIERLEIPETVVISDKLTEEEKYAGPEKNYLKALPKMTGAFHEKLEKNKKVNLGNATKARRDAKYKKPISRGDKKKKG
jgi:ATP-dependent RNA helicase RhlE